MKNDRWDIVFVVSIRQKIEKSFIHDVSQVSKNRWNHSVVVKSVEDAQCNDLKMTLLQSYNFASKK